MLAPIAGSAVAGVDGREDETAVGEMFREIRFQRKAIFRQEQRAAMGEDVGESDGWDWETLAENARDYLCDHSKDLEPMAILVEAATRVDGLPGLSRAMTAMADIIQNFWVDGLYPPGDEEDGEAARFQPLSGLSGGSGDKDGTLVLPLRRMLLAGDGQGELRFIDKVAADALSGSLSGTPAQKAERAQEAQVAFDDAEAVARRVSRRVLTVSVGHLEVAEAAWRRAVGFVSERTKPQFPSASRVSDELRNMNDWLQSLLRKLPEDPVDAAPAAVVARDGAGPAGGAVAAAGGPLVIGRISARDDALRAVAAAADYFERNEPSSPLGSALREVDRRARLSLDALLQELIPDETVRQTFYWRSGIKPPGGADT